MDKDILKSINLIKVRLENIKEAQNDFKKDIIPKKYYYDSIKLNLIEIGEESKIINDILLKDKGNWNHIISLSYNMRISLTHYYKEIYFDLIDSYMDKKISLFENEIINLEKEYKDLNKK